MNNLIRAPLLKQTGAQTVIWTEKNDLKCCAHRNAQSATNFLQLNCIDHVNGGLFETPHDFGDSLISVQRTIIKETTKPKATKPAHKNGRKASHE
jgi:hypothetical protein